ncbi:MULTISPECIES: GNAT family N-acetyltransferase [Actinomadura]|uniref:GNAT family N-acetyltransferase n=1 Tax=Actinomadura litoris TaxID=2678616 RepID=A0A7K1LBW8_9ACTN|nr:MULTISPECIES: GNAT family N-acetyltransferase [Actinomadura]MBT2213756.1 GNAT family N-acetyltransferase [Actinomadura sp. NEAU-AAG7]MUN41912.1 GNAT family N-acetyltransferase [Actinomadura litoris]
MLGSLPVRVLDDRYRAEALAILDADPVANVFVGSRVHAAGLDPRRLGAQMWGYLRDGRLTSLCYSGANLIPIAAGPEAVRAFAERAQAQGRRCSSIVGPVGAVGDLWEILAPYWGPPRAVRAVQPVMATSSVPEVPPDRAVRRVRMEEFDIVYPACVAMFTEEVGVSPNTGDGGVLYRARVAELIRDGRAFARIEDGRVMFKAEVGAVTPRACQVQGVWVPPDLRGRGLSVAGMSAVVGEALRAIAPTVSLYVNDYNTRARAAYRRVGFAEFGSFMSVLF